jgi:acyl-CoA hydrolase
VGATSPAERFEPGQRDNVTLRFVAAPQDADLSGKHVAAGSVMEWIDKAGYACAVGWSSSYCVTAYVGNVHHTRSIAPGDLVEVAARVVHTGSTSIHVLVRVSSSDMRGDLPRSAAHCLLVFVAVDQKGSARRVPAWRGLTAEDKELNRNARERIALRRAIHRETQQASFTETGTTPREVLRFLAQPRVANFNGHVHGGTVMRWINEAAYVCAARYSSARAEVAYSGGIHFHRPIRIGALVEVEARLIHTEASFMHISVHVRSSDPASPDLPQLTTRCMTIFNEQSVDGTTNVRPLNLLSEEDSSLDSLARRLARMRRTLPPVPDALGLSPVAS